MRCRNLLYGLAIAALVVLGCSGDSPTGPTAREPVAVQIVGGQDQSATVGTELPLALTAKVVDAQGRPVQGRTVSFRVTAGGGSVFVGSAVSSDSGLVQDRWTLGSTVADSHRVEVRTVNSAGEALLAVFRASARADAPASLSKSAGDGQTVVVGTAAADSLAVRVADRYGNPVPQVMVRWAATGGGSLSADSTASDVAGLARVRWTVGSEVGSSQQVTATVAALTPMVFTASLQAGAAVRLAILDSVTSAATGVPFATSPRVRLVDAFGNTASTSASAVSASASAGGTLVGTTTVVPVSGVATFAGLGLRGGAGSYSLTFSAAGLAGVSQQISLISPVPAMAVSAGYFHSMILAVDGTLWAAGRNYLGQLGDGTTVDRATPVPIMTGVADVSARYDHTLILKTDGTLWAAGRNLNGQLGDGTTVNRPTPVQVMTGVAAISTGAGHSMILKTDGTLWATGANNFGQLGDGTLVDRTTPVQIMTGVRSVSAGQTHTAIVKSDSTLWVTGGNEYGQLGDGTVVRKAAPVQVMTGVAAASAGGSHTMILKGDGTLWGSGGNNFGELGDGTRVRRTTPVQVMTAVKAVVAGGSDVSSNTRILRSDGTLWATGSNEVGQLGDGSSTGRLTPVQLMTDVAAMSAGGYHAFYLKSDGTLWATGANGYGQFGNGSTGNTSLIPVPIIP